MSAATCQAAGAVSIVTLNRPERLNAIDSALLADLHTALEAAHADASTRVIVLTGAGRAFCAGDDLEAFGEQSATPGAIEHTCEQIQRITRDIMFGPKLVIGAVQGWAVGGGFEWLLNCDLVVAADDLRCFMPEMALGHFVTGGVTHLLPRLVGRPRAIELIVLGEPQDAASLQRIGLVNRVVPAAELMREAMALANQVAARSPLAMAQLKRVIASQAEAQLETALELERHAAMTCFASPDTARRVNDFAVERLKRPRRRL